MAETKNTPKATEAELKAKAQEAQLKKRDEITDRLEALFNEAKKHNIMIRPAITKQETVVNGNLYVTSRPHMIVEPMTAQEIKMVEQEKANSMIDSAKDKKEEPAKE